MISSNAPIPRLLLNKPVNLKEHGYSIIYSPPVISLKTITSLCNCQTYERGESFCSRASRDIVRAFCHARYMRVEKPNLRNHPAKIILCAFWSGAHSSRTTVLGEQFERVLFAETVTTKLLPFENHRNDRRIDRHDVS